MSSGYARPAAVAPQGSQTRGRRRTANPSGSEDDTWSRAHHGHGHHLSATRLQAQGGNLPRVWDHAVGGEGNGDSGPRAERAVDIDTATVELHQPHRERQAEAGPCVFSAQLAVDLTERLQHARNVILRDSNTGI